MFDGLHLNLGNLYRLSEAESRSISAENYRGERGKGGMATEGIGANAARDLGRPWKISPAVSIGAGRTFEVADIKGPGAVQQIWLTPSGNWRYAILRFYWDGEEQPSIETPIGDFFCQGWCSYAHVNSLPICVNPGSAFNSYWTMPFRKQCRITVENLADEDMVLFYQVNYTLCPVPDDAAYLHAQWRRTNPLPYKQDYTLLDGVRGTGHYVGAYMAWQTNNTGWWGEGEIKFFLDGDEWPTICGTGTEDYFCGSYCFLLNGQYKDYTTPYVGFHQVVRPDGVYQSQTRFGMYRWHIMDPIRFRDDLRVTMQAIGWRSGGRYLPLQDDIASVAYWYQAEPHAPFPALPGRDCLEVI